MAGNSKITMEYIIEFKGKTRKVIIDAVALEERQELEICIQQDKLNVFAWLNLEQVQQLHAFLGEQLAKVK